MNPASVPFIPMGRPFDFNGDGIQEILIGSEIIDITGNGYSFYVTYPLN